MSAPTTFPPAVPAAASSSPPKREWAPRMWEGMDFFGWLRLLVRNRFAVGLSYLYIAVIVTFVSFGHTVLRLIQEIFYGSRIRRCRVAHPPLFIIGHWRTGTTLLHELLILDPRHNYPNTYRCLEPNHFLLTEKLVTRGLPFLMPSRRPMDNMAAGWDRPQEDEFALCMLGMSSPYLTIAFPNHGPQYTEYLDLETLSPRRRERWKQGFHRFLQGLTFTDPRRLVLKSPTHSCRIRTLLEMYPDAQFVHIVRDPFVVYPSTMNLWRSLYETHGFQKPTCAGLQEHVLETFTHMYRKIDEGRALVDPSRFYELRYEDLIRDPLAEMRKLYEHLGLGEFERVRPRLEQYLSENAGYQTNRYPRLSADERGMIRERWGEVIDRHGYTDPV